MPSRQTGSARCSRREFVKTAGRAGAGLVILANSRSAFGYPENEKLSIAIIGAGGRGRANLASVASERIIALCDVNDQKAADSYNRFPAAKKYHDYRRLLDELDRRIDAVVVSTVNHSHAPATVMAMRRGKHVYCEKPGAHSARKSGSQPSWSAFEKPLGQFVSGHSKVLGDVPQDAGERSHPQRIVGGNRNVMLSPLLCGEANVRSLLPGHVVAVCP